MKILITSGGTAEQIDQVRDITNQATGRLGKILAETFLEAGHEVTLLAGKTALLPEPQAGLTLHQVTDVQSLIQLLEPLVQEHQVLIHAMAVSDYSPVSMVDFEQVQRSQDLTEFLQQTETAGKISSAADYQVLFLRKTPKVISLVKGWNPDIQLIGFKLLVDADEADLLKAARESRLKNQADYILANDLTQISGDRHLAYLIGSEHVETARTKQEIAQLILQKVTERS